MSTQQISPAQRAALFAQATRQTYQTLPTYSATELETVQISIPKARLLSRITLQVEAVATLKAGSAKNLPLKAFSPYEIIRRVQLDLNNGFSPFVLSGKDAFLYALNRFNPDMIYPQSNPRGNVYVEQAATTTGKDAVIKFDLDLPVTLNERDAVGLILLQNEETSVNVTVDVGELKNAYQLESGETVTFKSLKITPLTETYTIPPAKEAFPDISVLKLVQSRQEAFTQGQNVMKLQTGTIYRKLTLYFEDAETGEALTDADIKSNIEFVFNTADVPISIKPSILASKNAKELGYTLPQGVYSFDWSYQGIPNLGGTRDYIDTERLTEFWLRFTTEKAVKVTVVPETLSRLA